MKILPGYRCQDGGQFGHYECFSPLPLLRFFLSRGSGYKDELQNTDEQSGMRGKNRPYFKLIGTAGNILR